MKRRPPDRSESRSLAELFGGLRSNYDMATASRYVRGRSGYAASGSSADYHYRSESDFLKCLELARELDRNSLGGVMLNRVTTNIIGDGLTVEPQTGDDKLDRDLWDYWQAWSTDPLACDLMGESTFAHMQWLMLRSMIGDGDCFALLTDDGPVQMIESHRCRTPAGTKRNVVHGVLLSADRARLQYWFTKDDLDPWATVSRVSDVQQYEARYPDGRPRVLHFRDELRLSQTRGISAFAAIFRKFVMADDLEFAKLVQAMAVSCHWVLHNPGPVVTGATPAPAGEQTQELLSDGSTYRTIEGLTPGQHLYGEAGETLSAWSPNVPNPEYLPYATDLWQKTAAAMDLPLIAFMLDGTKTNFSGFRGAINEARRGWRRKQHMTRDRLVSPTYRHQVHRWSERDRVLRRWLEQSTAPGAAVDPLRHQVHLPVWPYIQPEIEANADAVRIEKGLSSRRRVAAERGADSEDLAIEITQDNKYLVVQAYRAAQEAEAEIKARTGREVRLDPRQMLHVDPARPLELANGVPEELTTQVNRGAVKTQAEAEEDPDNQESDESDEERR